MRVVELFITFSTACFSLKKKHDDTNHIPQRNITNWDVQKPERSLKCLVPRLEPMATHVLILFRFVQAQIQTTDTLLEEQRFITGPIESWLSSFVAWADNGTEYRCSK